ncbi:MAG: hypothetical protein PHQ40_03600 [Anaerolineaceae bacterium]|nr:hypothetical protein [Anaerolineaceae bacterium]
MENLIDFILNHPKCTKLMCPTCGGLLAFNSELHIWIEANSIDLQKEVERLSPESLEGLENWPVLMDQVLHAFPKNSDLEHIYQSWQRQTGRVPGFDRFLITHAPAGSCVIEEDSHWIEACLTGELHSFSEDELTMVEQFLGQDIHLFPSVQRQRQFLQDMRVARNELKQRENEEKLARADANRIEWNETVRRISGLDALTRLREILLDERWPLCDFPNEWADIPTACFDGLSSSELTLWIRRLTRRISRHEKGPWKDLRSRLFHQRQTVYNQEHLRKTD